MLTPCFTEGYGAPEVVKLAPPGSVPAASGPAGLADEHGSTIAPLPALGKRALGALGGPAVGYDASCDLWSLGIILYTMLCGYPPFFSRRKDVSSSDLLKRMTEESLTYPADQWRDIAAEAKHLVSGLVVTDSKKRLTTAQVLAHDWIKEYIKVNGRLARRGSMLLTPGVLRSPDFTFKIKRSRSHLGEMCDRLADVGRKVHDKDAVAVVPSLPDTSISGMGPLDENKLVKRRKLKGSRSSTGSSAGSVEPPHITPEPSHTNPEPS